MNYYAALKTMLANTQGQNVKPEVSYVMSVESLYAALAFSNYKAGLHEGSQICLPEL